ncbi:MAG: Peroxiredoxin [Bacteroidota bacterium]|nr:Peroxiredoxin [Bacteroidota bacterium]
MAKSIYDFEVKDLAGKSVKLSDYKGKVLLIVNIASKCGNTPQLGGLETIYEKYRGQGFEILAFPSNDFMQEPKEGANIEQFCTKNYGVQFKVFEKGHVRGKSATDLYKYLTDQSSFGFMKAPPIWNFQKYLVDRKGKVVDFFNPWKAPDSAKITESIENCLKEVA